MSTGPKSSIRRGHLVDGKFVHTQIHRTDTPPLPDPILRAIQLLRDVASAGVKKDMPKHLQDFFAADANNHLVQLDPGVCRECAECADALELLRVEVNTERPPFPLAHHSPGLTPPDPSTPWDIGEICISCGRTLNMLRSQDVQSRSWYVEGSGQMCPTCYDRIYPDEFVNPGDRQLRELGLEFDDE